MKITAVAKLKHGDLWNAIKGLGWSQSEFGRRCDISPQIIGYIINLQKRPSESIQIKIQSVLAENGVYFDPITAWPDGFTGVKKALIRESTKEISVPQLQSLTKDTLFIAADTDTSLEVQKAEARELLKKTLKILTFREREIIKLRYGLEDGSTYTLEEVGRIFKVTRETVRHIEMKALRKLQHYFEKQELTHIFNTTEAIKTLLEH